MQFLILLVTTSSTVVLVKRGQLLHLFGLAQVSRAAETLQTAHLGCKRRTLMAVQLDKHVTSYTDLRDLLPRPIPPTYDCSNYHIAPVGPQPSPLQLGIQRVQIEVHKCADSLFI